MPCRTKDQWAALLGCIHPDKIDFVLVQLGYRPDVIPVIKGFAAGRDVRYNGVLQQDDVAFLGIGRYTLVPTTAGQKLQAIKDALVASPHAPRSLLEDSLDRIRSIINEV